MNLRPPPRLLWEPIVRRALEEDLGLAGDLTTDAIVPAGAVVSADVVARESGVAAGVEIAAEAFHQMDGAVEVLPGAADGSSVAAGERLFSVTGSARAVLTGERTALNLLGRLSGIATSTRGVVDAVAGTGVKVAATRKTTLGLRILEKYAVRCGGGVDHRYGLDDAVLVKDNHLVIAGGVAEAVRRVRASVGHLVKVEVEVDTVEQLDAALGAGVDVVLLDNMALDELRAAVALTDGRAVLEASGGITPGNAAAVAATGVDVISLGWLTHSVPSLDVALDVAG